MLRFTAFVLFVSLGAVAAQAHMICTVVADARMGRILKQQGDCATRVTPASTFKIAISLMGYDAGFLKDEHIPALPFRSGYPDWMPTWHQTIDPTSWIKYSVVWYSQKVTEALGERRFQKYVAAFHYGNTDVSGDPGKHNGLMRAWLSSSLKISPLEQIAFLEKVVDRQLPVMPRAFEMTDRITAVTTLAAGWTVHGKTGTGAPLEPGGAQDTAHSYGWFVGWAENGKQRIVFARLIQDDKLATDYAGPRARAGLLNELSSLLSTTH